MKFVSKVNPFKFVQFAERVWGVNGADEGIAAFEKFLKDIGMPLSMKEFGAKEEDIPKLARHIGRVSETEKNFGGYVKLDIADVEEIYRLAL
jgi:hypothetical protein